MIWRRSLGLAVAGLLLRGPAAFAAVGPCTETTEVTTAGASSYTSLSDRPARLCGVHLIATAANAWCHVIDSPSSTNPTHGQARTIAEPASATSLNGDHAWFGDNGYPTRFGLGVAVTNGRCIVHWGSTP